MSKRKPLILVTNDDGIFAGGIQALTKVAREFGRVLVVAPDKPQSGMGHAITVGNLLRLRKVDEGQDYMAYSCTGTPVDSVKLAIYKILKGQKPDLLLSGINHGANHSINVIYSGTMSAAVEGAVEGIPSVGFSLLNHSANADFSASEEVVRRVVANVLKHDFPKDCCLNVNIPDLPIEQMRGIKIARQARAFWSDDFDSRTDPSGQEYFWLTGKFNNPDKGEDTDVWALDNNYVSVVPVQYDLTAHHAMSALNTWNNALH